MATKKAKVRASTTASTTGIKGRAAAAAPPRGAGGALACGPAGCAGVVEARELRIIDDAGVVRAVLGMTRGRGGRGAAPRLTLMHKDGTEAFEVTLARDEPVVRLTDAAGRTRIFLAVAGIGGDEARIALSDDAGRPRLFIGVRSSGRPTLAVYDAAKKKVWEAPG